MSIQYKFRSSVYFDSVEIDGQPSISVGDLRAKIFRQKNLNLSQGLDLLFSDALTGLEYKSYNDQIASGSSVIVKRVPAEMVPSTMTPANFDDKLRIRDSKFAIPRSICLPVEEDLYPILKKATDHNLQFDKQNCVGDEMPKNASPRLHMPVELKGGEHIPIKKMGGAHCRALKKVDLSSDFTCSLCSTFFKEAVMIPCCQHTFCLKCISNILIQNGRCPKCESSKCDVADLLPNITLRRAVEQFLESKGLMCDEDKPLRKDAPDVESGNQAADYCYAVPIGHRELKAPGFSSASGEGSNQIIGESVFESRIRNNMCGSHACNFGASKISNAAVSPHKFGQIDGREVTISPDFQGKNQPHDIQQRFLHGKGGDNSCTRIRRHGKGDCTCYMCGSPDHSMRDCPITSNPLPMLPSGYGSPFGNRIAVDPMGPYSNMHVNSGIMHFNPAMLPASPCVVPPYMPSMYGGRPVPSGVIRKGVTNNFTPQYGAGLKYSIHPSQSLELRNSENRRRISNEILRSGRSYGDEDDNKCLHTTEPEKSLKYKDRVEREQSASYFEDSFPPRSRKKNKEYHYRDNDRVQRSDRSNLSPRKQRSNHKRKRVQ